MSSDPQPVWLQQSPIDIIHSETRHTDFGPDYLKIDYPAEEVQGTYYDGQFLLHSPVRVRFDGQDCQLVKLHIHSRSEHRLDNHTYPFEIHFVHQITYPTKGSAFLVIGAFLKLDENASERPGIRALNEMLRNFRDQGKSTKSEPVSHMLPLNSFLPDDRSRWYRYEGSLTSSNYPENVSWVVLKEEVPVHPATVAELEREAGHKARRVCPINRRVVLRSWHN